jgi:hypothetical protein
VTDEWQFIEGYSVGGTIRTSKSVIEEKGKTSKARRFLGMTEGAILIIANGIKVFQLNCRA